jgi:TatD DNase family protein
VIVDSHCHLADEAFDADRLAVVARAREAGVGRVLCILAADDPAELRRAVEDVSPVWPEVLYATAVHPHRAAAYRDDPLGAVSCTRRAAADVAAVAFGEMGLDYHYDFAPRETQQAVFAGQVALAVELGKPVVIHTREAADDTLAILRDAGKGEVRGVMHCFTGSRDEARLALDLGFWISFSGILTFPRATDLRDVAAFVPPDRLLVETDAPYLAPVPHRGARNEPAWVVETLACLAGLHGRTREEMAGQVAANFEALLSGATATSRGEAPAGRVDT